MDIDKLRGMAEVVAAEHREMLAAHRRASEAVCNLFNALVIECDVKDPPRFTFRGGSLSRDVISILREFKEKATKNHETIDAVITIMKKRA